MTQKEFQDRVKMQVSAEEYDAIEVVYMNCDLDKDEFCKMWAKINKSRIAKYAKEQKAIREHQAKKEAIWKAYEMLVVKAQKFGYGADVCEVCTIAQRKMLEKLGISDFDYGTVAMAKSIAIGLYNRM